MNSIHYYDQNAEAFYQRTIGLTDIVHAYKKFLQPLSSEARILEAGCGVGRDSKYFKQQGYEILAFDASSEMVRLSSIEIGQPSLKLNFYDMLFDQEFDGVWACTSLLHVPYEKTSIVFEKIKNALKPKGIFYASYKYGSKKMTSTARDFYNMDETTIVPYLKHFFELIEIWKTPDTTSQVNPSPAKAWLNVLCQKI